MSERDLPWNDVPADSDVVPGTEEPDPAEVEGDEDDDAEVDLSRPAVPDIAAKYHRDTLDERLAEEEPDRTLPEDEQEPEAGTIMAAESDQDEVTLGLGEPDADDGDDDDEAAEDAAVHIQSRDR
jgi:hypothetical protein